MYKSYKEISKMEKAASNNFLQTIFLGVFKSCVAKLKCHAASSTSKAQWILILEFLFSLHFSMKCIWIHFRQLNQMLLIKILFYIFAHKNIFSITRANPRSYHTFQSRKESCVPNTVKYIEAPTQFKRCSHTCWESLEWYVCNHRRFYNIYTM